MSDLREKLLSELFLTCMQLTDKNFTAFFEYVAHCDFVEVNVHKFGWETSNEKCFSSQIYIEPEDCDDEEFKECVLETIEEIKNLKKEGKEIKIAREKDATLYKQQKKERLLKELEELEKG